MNGALRQVQRCIHGETWKNAKNGKGGHMTSGKNKSGRKPMNRIAHFNIAAIAIFFHLTLLTPDRSFSSAKWDFFTMDIASKISHNSNSLSLRLEAPDDFDETLLISIKNVLINHGLVLADSGKRATLNIETQHSVFNEFFGLSIRRLTISLSDGVQYSTVWAPFFIAGSKFYICAFASILLSWIWILTVYLGVSHYWPWFFRWLGHITAALFLALPFAGMGYAWFKHGIIFF